MIKCQLCNKEFLRITNSHLKTHNISIQDYLRKYPNSPIISEESCRKMSTIMLGNTNWMSEKFIFFNSNKDPIVIDKRRKSCKATWGKKSKEEIANHVKKSVKKRYKKYNVFFNNTLLYFKSSLEVQFFNIMRDNYKIEYEPTSFYYHIDGVRRRYVPDFLINNNVFVEVKPYYLIEDKIVQLKKKAVIDEGYSFLFFTKNDIKEFDNFVYRLKMNFLTHGGNQQPIPSNQANKVDGPVQRLTLKEALTNNRDTSAEHPINHRMMI